jgi:hypothetical protein
VLAPILATVGQVDLTGPRRPSQARDVSDPSRAAPHRSGAERADSGGEPRQREWIWASRAC